MKAIYKEEEKIRGRKTGGEKHSRKNSLCLEILYFTYSYHQACFLVLSAARPYLFLFLCFLVPLSFYFTTSFMDSIWLGLAFSSTGVISALYTQVHLALFVFGLSLLGFVSIIAPLLLFSQLI